MKIKTVKPILVDNKEEIKLGSIVLHPIFGLGIIKIESEILYFYNIHKSGDLFRSPLRNMIDDLINKQLIFISLDDEIKAGDLVLLPDNTLHTMTHSDMINYLDSQSYATKKVIARQYQIPNKYIQQFIEEYNKGEVKDIEIEMETQYDKPYINGMLSFKGIQPKLTNGFITIVNPTFKNN